ncbi:putative E3 ubiquitin-protein ligase RF4 [Carica papaya]|uniref:putative E3 ubiquitin-protein ligase RF4 n=1 Tax=Carica papaya TaxID=3649 RepID=UPI000B8CC542|nr:putative E3 ubiquitin-protein ligase RF4 [Carica papaya]
MRGVLLSSDTGFDYHPVLLDGFVGKIKTLGLVFDFGFLGNLVCNPFECFFLKDIGFYARLAVTATGSGTSIEATRDQIRRYLHDKKMEEMGTQNGSKIGSSSSSSSSTVAKVSNKNKRKLADTYDIAHDREIPITSTGSSGSSHSQPVPGVTEVEDYEPGGWEDPLAYQLEELLISQILLVYQHAIRLIKLDFGYPEDLIQKALTGRGFYCGAKDPVPNIVHFTVEILKKGNQNSIFDNLQQLVNFTLVEMVGVVREVKQGLSVVDAMWALLLCDLNVAQICQEEGEMMTSFTTQNVPAPPQPVADQPGVETKPVVQEEKPASSSSSQKSKKKANKKKGKGKKSTGGEKKPDPPSELPPANLTISDNPPTPTSITKPPASSSITPDFLAGIPYDPSLGKYLPRDKKEELIIQLVARKQELQSELQGWTDWANNKVMQTTHRLKTDFELRSLRQEKVDAVKSQKDKQTIEENTMKRLNEMDLAVKNANEQVEKAKATASKLEIEQAVLKKDMEAAKSHASKSAVSLKEAKENEQKRGKEVQAMEGERTMLHQELESQRRSLAQLQKQFDTAKNRADQSEGRWRKEKSEKEKLLAQAAAIRKEREELEAATEAEEASMKNQAEADMKKCMDDIKDLEKKVSEMKLASEASKIAEMKKD